MYIHVCMCVLCEHVQVCSVHMYMFVLCACMCVYVCGGGGLVLTPPRGGPGNSTDG